MDSGRHRRRVPGDADGPLFERWVLSLGVGQWSTLDLVITLGCLALFSGVAAGYLYDDWALNQRAQIVQAQVVRTFYDDAEPAVEAELLSPHRGVPVSVEPIESRPAVGDVIELLVDPRKPTRVRDPKSGHWNALHFIGVACAPVGAAIWWARWNRWRRRPRPRNRR
ncbi:hypothetical protein [Kribbella deserti]|uniref:DUF3592 domain-containing protein n=1 Tax=Kribbella deserti TaxID=1926257 RepID=A0ABV6QD73_9ACTN